jgi:hypothetical protein
MRVFNSQDISIVDYLKITMLGLPIFLTHTPFLIAHEQNQAAAVICHGSFFSPAGVYYCFPIIFMLDTHEIAATFD